MLKEVYNTLKAFNNQPQLLSLLGVAGLNMLTPSNRSDDVPVELVPYMHFLQAIPGFNKTLACQANGFSDAAHTCHPSSPFFCNDFKSILNGTLTLWGSATTLRPFGLLRFGTSFYASALLLAASAIWALLLNAASRS